MWPEENTCLQRQAGGCLRESTALLPDRHPLWPCVFVLFFQGLGTCQCLGKTLPLAIWMEVGWEAWVKPGFVPARCQLCTLVGWGAAVGVASLSSDGVTDLTTLEPSGCQARVGVQGRGLSHAACRQPCYLASPSASLQRWSCLSSFTQA